MTSDIVVEIVKDSAGFPSIVTATEGQQKVTITYDATRGFRIQRSRRTISPELMDVLKLIYPPTETKTTKLADVKESPLTGRVTSDPRNFIERWEYLVDEKYKRDFFFGEYTGRSYPLSPVWMTECGTDPTAWTLPKIKVAAGPTAEPLRWRNVIDMTNSKNGTTIDELYIEPRRSFEPPCIMRITCKLPDPATVPAGTELLFGFEVNSQGGAAIYSFYVENGFCGIKTKCMTPTGVNEVQTAAVLVTPTVFMSYWLEYSPPYLRLFQYSGGVTNLLATATIVGAIAYDVVSPFITNESSSIVVGFEVNHWAIWQRRWAAQIIQGTYTPAAGDTKVKIATA